MFSKRTLISNAKYLIEVIRTCKQRGLNELAEHVLSHHLPVLMDKIIASPENDPPEIRELVTQLEQLQKFLRNDDGPFEWELRAPVVDEWSILSSTSSRLTAWINHLQQFNNKNDRPEDREPPKPVNLPNFLKKDRYRLDVATQKPVAANEWFFIAVAIKNLESAIAVLEGLPDTKSGDMKIKWPRNNQVQFRVEVTAPDCEISPASIQRLSLDRYEDSVVLYFRLKTSKIGQIGVVIRVFQETPQEHEVTSLHFMKTINQTLSGKVKLQLKMQKPLQNFPENIDQYAEIEEESSITPEAIPNWAYRSAYPIIETINSREIKDEVIEALRLFDVDNIGLGLFSLGKVLETQVKTYLTHFRQKSPNSVTAKDLERLSTMISCLQRLGFETDRRDLDMLRIERNEQAHGQIPTKKEKKELLGLSPFYGDLYLRYISKYEQKTAELLQG